MKLVHKIVLFNLLIALIVTYCVYYSYNMGPFEDFLLFLFAVCMVGGIADIFITLILLLAKKRTWAKGYLMTTLLLFCICLVLAVLGKMTRAI